MASLSFQAVSGYTQIRVIQLLSNLGRMMPIQKLTGAVIPKLGPKLNEDGTQSREWYWDTGHKGLCLRVGARDKTWLVYYRFDGKQRNQRLGAFAPDRVDHMDRDAAVNEAARIETLAGKGIDPRQETKPAREKKVKPTTENPNALHRRVKEFLKWYKTSPTKRGGKLRSKATIQQAKRLLTDKGKYYYLAPLAHSDVSAIKRADILRLLENMSDNPFQTNRIQSYLDLFFTYCWDRGYCDPSPMAGLKKQYAEESRERTLSPAEIKQLWHGCITLAYPWGDLCRFVMATGQRPGECRKLNRNDIVNDVWLVEGGDPKNRERHRIPLPPIALEIIRKAPEHEGPYLFTTTQGKRPVGQGGKPYKALKDAAGFSDWQPRDLRRTFITMASEELDIDTQLIGAICNQLSVSKPGVAGVYNKATWIKQKGKALEAWNAYLGRIVK